MQTKEPMISIIIPVYNAAKTLDQCVDALVYQTYENIEILIMEKKSTDNSLEIARRFEKEFPGKVRAIELPYTENPARAINEGVKAAKGDYVCFNDPDDYFNLDAMEIIAKKIMRDPFEMAFFDANVVDAAGSVIRASHIAQPFCKKNLLTNMDLMTYWRTCIKRDFFLSHDPVIETCKYADLTWIPLFIADARKIEYIPEKLYNYLANNGFTAANKISNASSLEILQGFDHLLEKADKMFYDEIVMFVITRFVPMAKNWNHHTYYMAWAQKYKDVFLENKYLKERQVYRDYLEKAFDTYVEDHIPYTAYIDGFSCPDNKEQYREYVQGKAFIKGEGDVVALDESTCDLSQLPHAREALDSGNTEYLSHFFALKNIYENGGCFVGKDIRFTAQLDSSCIYDSFFAFKTDESFNDQIFGGHAGSEFIKQLLDTYLTPDFFDDPFLPFADRLRIIAGVTLSKLKVNGRDSLVDDKIRFYSVEKMTLGAGLPEEICYVDFSSLVSDPDSRKNMLIVPFDVFNSAELSVSSTGNSQKLNDQIRALKNRISQIEGSDSYKFAKRLSRFGNTKFGTPFKRVFKWFLKKYRKRKYGMG